MAESGPQPPGGAPSRHEKSLGLLTTKFVSLLQEAKDGVLDLKLPVLDRGVGPGCNTREIAHKLIELKAEIEDLEHRERELEQQKMWVQQSIRNVTDDVQNKELAYVTDEDLCKCFPGDTLLAIRAPSGTQLEVPVPEGLNGQRKYQIHLKSSNDSIDVLLVNKDAWSSPPVVLPVPPPEDLIQCQPITPSKKPSLAPSQEASLPSGAHPPASVPSSTQDHRCSVPKSTETGTSTAESKSSEELDSLTPSTVPASPPAGLDTQPLQSSALLDSSSVLPSSFTSFEPIKSFPTEILELPKELSEMFEPTRECVNSELLEELMSSEVFAPLLRLSPPPGDHDYIYNLDESEGVCDLFDVPILNL
ncbi:transcription factor E2F4 [Pantherophis guttatus]|uniref:Transcription factor E2F4 n=1 Tax=Pantherophis guttatus TaxID=94885 RepID=A0ABM3YNA1_PANGU|nr:transcription factor E2F4 [Pantherophis guttatus]